MNKLGIFGHGKMGKAIEEIGTSDQFNKILHIKIYHKGEDIKKFIDSCDVIIDFSNANGTEFLVSNLLNHQLEKPCLIGTTALYNETINKISTLSHKSPIMIAPNVSLGANLLANISSKIAAMIHSEYDIDIIDIHHNQKIDNPSGTALMIKNEIVNNLNITTKNISSESGDSIKQINNIENKSFEEKVKIHSIRAGSYPGEHKIIFSGDEDSFEISHKILNRKLLAKSAIKAAIWLNRQTPGKYQITSMYNKL